MPAPRETMVKPSASTSSSTAVVISQPAIASQAGSVNK